MVQSSQKCSRELSRNICVRLLSMIATNRDKGLMCREITCDRRNAFWELVAFALLFSPSSPEKGTGSGLRSSQLSMPRREMETTIMRTYLICLLASVLFVASISMPVVAQQNNSEGMTLDKVKAKVAKLGTGEKAKATVILKDGTKIKGYIGQAGSDEFVLRDRKTDSPTTIPYSDVSKVESNKGHSTARNLGLGIGIGAGAFLGILLIAIAHLD